EAVVRIAAAEALADLGGAQALRYLCAALQRIPKNIRFDTKSGPVFLPNHEWQVFARCVVRVRRTASSPIQSFISDAGNARLNKIALQAEKLVKLRIDEESLARLWVSFRNRFIPVTVNLKEAEEFENTFINFFFKAMLVAVNASSTKEEFPVKLSNIEDIAIVEINKTPASKVSDISGLFESWLNNAFIDLNMAYHFLDGAGLFVDNFCKTLGSRPMDLTLALKQYIDKEVNVSNWAKGMAGDNKSVEAVHKFIAKQLTAFIEIYLEEIGGEDEIDASGLAEEEKTLLFNWYQEGNWPAIKELLDGRGILKSPTYLPIPDLLPLDNIDNLAMQLREIGAALSNEKAIKQAGELIRIRALKQKDVAQEESSLILLLNLKKYLDETAEKAVKSRILG
ncbi:MAG: hypothetical protein Q8K15_02310, partial [Candidatus Omnitrophota bacterium]|nr:hypothetical protein [Candidatus Omnitrophota bacterium]